MSNRPTAHPHPTASQQLERYRIALFESHLAYVQACYLEPWARGLASSPPRSQAGGGQATGEGEGPLALIIDDRPSRLLRACVLNTLLMGRCRWRVRCLTSTASLQACRQLLADLPGWVEVQSVAGTEGDTMPGARGLGEGRLAWSGYNQLLKTEAFWRRLGCRRVLIFQVDTLLIEPPDPAVFRYGYVGSPWARGRYVSQCFPRYRADLTPAPPRWETRALCRTVPEGAVNGNGGLSVRDPQLMARICREQPSSDGEPEDIYFARHLPHYDPDPVPLALLERFSCETHYALSAGAHAAWRYISAEETAAMFERHLKQVIGLCEAGLG